MIWNDDSWTDKISNPAQVGGIETSVIDNGPGRGTRIAWVNTGAGLRYKVVIDRAMDIADAFYNQYSLAWLSHSGITAPAPFSDKGADWLRTFGGGLLTTCGLTHVGGPETDAFGERGLHGQISNLPAELESVLQPDPAAGNLEMSISGTVKQTQALGPNLELNRKISGKIGRPAIRIKDVVTNRGNSPSPLMVLYHLNFGWPLVDVGTDILWEGPWHAREPAPEVKIFKKGNNFRKCSPPIEDHTGRGEEACFIDITPDPTGQCVCGLYNRRIGLLLVLRFRKEQLPWLTNWQHWGKREYVTGLEPGTNVPTGQASARKEGTLIHLAPGESRTFELEIAIAAEKNKINELLKKMSST